VEQKSPLQSLCTSRHRQRKRCNVPLAAATPHSACSALGRIPQLPGRCCNV